MAWNNVEVELILKEADPLNISPALQVDFKINGLWEAERAACFDSRIVNAVAPSYATKDWMTISRDHALQKHNKCGHAAEDVRGSFTPLICSAECVIKNIVSFKTYLGRHCR